MFKKFLCFPVVCGIVGGSSVIAFASPNIKTANKSTQTKALPTSIVWGLGGSAYGDRHGNDWKVVRDPGDGRLGVRIFANLDILAKSIKSLGVNNSEDDYVRLAARAGITLRTGQVKDKVKFYEENNAGKQ